MTKANWPAWYYGPGGEGRIFQNAGDVPKGWTDDPYAHERGEPGPADANRNGYATIPEIKAALEAGTVTIDEVEKAELERDKPRAGVLKLIEEAREAAKSTEHEVITREQALEELRGAGVEIADDATDEEIEAALAGLEG